MTTAGDQTSDRGDAVCLDGDSGSTSLSVALLTPVFVVLMFAAVQAALWGHARTEARIAAKTAAVQVARQGLSAGDARAAVRANLADAGIDDVTISIEDGNGLVVVRVTGQARGILIGTSRGVSVVEAIPVEELTPR
jgi:Flp pilus assembly protein TadG